MQPLDNSNDNRADDVNSESEEERKGGQEVIRQKE